jgi:hypothetical protein
MEPHKTLVFEYSEMPENIKKMLIDYYKGTDQRSILNDSYTRYPYLFDFYINCEVDELEKWFHKKMNYESVSYIIIHWEW